MHVRVTNRRRGTKTYRSVQIVHSYRRPDGMPASRVIASFGNLPELETQNLKAAIAASREGKTLVVAEEAAQAAWKVARNLAWYDAGVAYRIWQAWGLTELIDELAPDSLAEVSTGEVAAALTVQRCVEPDSKLAATRWYRTTALPELQGIAPARLNNTRIHRALEGLDRIEQPLQQRLARRIAARNGPFVCLFLDCTDTWFVGRGPELACKRVTKEGLLRKRIGIVLLCDSRGFPLRWATVAGNHDEATTMRDILRSASKQSWFEDVPFVVDRAMGHKVTVNELVESELPFVTAVPVDELASYSPRIPLGGFDDVELKSGERNDKRALKTLRDKAEKQGFEQISAKRHVLDLGVFAKADGSPLPGLVPSRAVATLRLAHQARIELERGGMTQEQLAERWKVSTRALRRHLEALDLEPVIQERIFAGDADRLSVKTLLTIAQQAPGEQKAAFEQALAAVDEQGPALRPRKAVLDVLDVPPVKVRGVVLFNPERFLEQRRNAQVKLDKLHEHVDKLNRQLALPGSRMKPERILANVGAELKHHKLLSIFETRVETRTVAGREAHQVRLLRDDEQWQRRRRADGLTLLITHPSVECRTAELVELYFAKDKVEKDFKQIKSVLDLRPVLHRTDPKVRAHVSLCMLALLVQRDLERRLGDGGVKMTAAWALHTLSTARLNRYDVDTPTYSATKPSRAQQRILAALGMEDLANDEAVAEELTPR